MADNIVFNNIPVGIRTPGHYIEIDNSKATSGLPGQARRLLVVGQRLPAGTAKAQTPVSVTNAPQAAQLFGLGSQLALSVAAVIDTAASLSVTAVALDDDNAAIKAEHTIALTNTPLEAGIIELYIAGNLVQLAVAKSETNATSASNLSAAISAKQDLPVSASSAAGVVTLTAKNGGQVGNIDVRLNHYAGDALPDGLEATINQTVFGQGNPDITLALDAIADDQFITIACPWTDSVNLIALDKELVNRFGPMSQKTGHAFVANSGTHAELTTFGANFNYVHLTSWGLHGSPTADYIRASVLAAVVELSASIDPARPFQTLTLPGILSPAEADRFSRTERDLLLHSGISTSMSTAGGEIIERVITMYQSNAFGIEDVSYLDLNTKLTVDYIRYAVRARIALRYPRHKLADDGTNFAPGQPVVTPKILTGELLLLFRELEQAGLVENFDQFKKDLIVTRSDSDKNRVNAIIPPDVINQLRVFAASVQFRL